MAVIYCPNTIFKHPRLLFPADQTGIATEIKVDAEEFDSYEIQSPPITLAFHLREFHVRKLVVNLPRIL
jgi:hypothetical protein